MQTRLKKYLQAKGFKANPFETTNAEQEQDRLPSFFVRVPWFDWLVGDPQSPQSLVLFAPQGYGKTSHRLEVSRLASVPTREQRALPVILNDVNLLLYEGIEHVTIQTYLSIIRRKTLEALVAHLAEVPEQMEALRQDVATFTRLWALLRLYAPRQRLTGEGTESSLSALIHGYQQVPLSPREWLKEELFPLVQSAGFASVYVLIDGLDESAETRDNQAAIFRLLSPLLDAPGLLQGCGFAFKFFLPQFLEEPMLAQGVGRLDRIPHRSISWTEEKMVEMLSQRLKSFSFDETISASYVQSFQDLCDVEFNADRYLVQAACSSPRRMIDICRRIIELHCEQFAGEDVQITAATINRVLEAYDPSVVLSVPCTSTSSERVQPEASFQPEVRVPVSSVVDSPPLLLLDSRGDIWLGDVRIDRTLPGILRRCMDYLWENRHRTVRYEELEQILWDESERAVLANPRDSCNKHIRRLRELLEPGQPGSKRYIDVQPRIGYVLRNVREE